MSAVLVEAMADLGFERFFLSSHDRGGRCAYRLALDSSSTRTTWRQGGGSAARYSPCGPDAMSSAAGSTCSRLRRWAEDVRGHAIDAGHFRAEERPHEATEELHEFFCE
jgi:hypothetical protein